MSNANRSEALRLRIVAQMEEGTRQAKADAEAEYARAGAAMAAHAAAGKAWKSWSGWKAVVS